MRRASRFLAAATLLALLAQWRCLRTVRDHDQPRRYAVRAEAVERLPVLSADAPPFFVIHGDYDTLAFVEDARLFVSALRGVSEQPVVYAEVPYAQHAFDIFHSERSAHAVNAVARFVEWVRARDGHAAA